MSFDLKIVGNDLVINLDGSVQTVRDNTKLAQECIKALVTPLGSNRFYSWYGNSLASTVIGQMMSNTLMEVEAERSISNTLNNVSLLQREQSKTQYVSAGETIAGIQNISVLQDDQDPRQYQIIVSILTRKLTIIEETFSLQV